MIARVNRDGTWTAMTLGAALEFVASNPYAPMHALTAEAAAEYRARVEEHRAEHGVRPATPDEIQILEEWRRLQEQKAAAKERGWVFWTIERGPGARHIVTLGGEPQLASEVARMSILHQAERGDDQASDFYLPRLLDQVDAHDGVSR